LSRNVNYTGRHKDVKKETTKTPPAKMFGPVRATMGEGLQTATVEKAKKTKRQKKKQKKIPGTSVVPRKFFFSSRTLPANPCIS